MTMKRRGQSSIAHPPPACRPLQGIRGGVTFMGTPRVPQMNNRDIPRATRFRPEIPPYSGMHDTSIP